jgi:hypothetical protein
VSVRVSFSTRSSAVSNQRYPVGPARQHRRIRIPAFRVVAFLGIAYGEYRALCSCGSSFRNTHGSASGLPRHWQGLRSIVFGAQRPVSASTLHAVGDASTANVGQGASNGEMSRGWDFLVNTLNVEVAQLGSTARRREIEVFESVADSFSGSAKDHRRAGSAYQKRIVPSALAETRVLPSGKNFT